MATKMNLTDEIRRITNENAASVAATALQVAEQAKQKAAEVSSLAIAEALRAATLAATKAADAASAAATIAASTSKDLEYIKKDIADTKSDIKEIKDKLDDKYVTKTAMDVFVRANDARHVEEGKIVDKFANQVEKCAVILEQFTTVKNIVYGATALILIAVFTSLVYLVVKR